MGESQGGLQAGDNSECRGPEARDAGRVSGAARRPARPEPEGKQGEVGRMWPEVGDARFWGALEAMVRNWDVTLSAKDLSMGIR